MTVDDYEIFLHNFFDFAVFVDHTEVAFAATKFFNVECAECYYRQFVYKRKRICIVKQGFEYRRRQFFADAHLLILTALRSTPVAQTEFGEEYLRCTETNMPIGKVSEAVGFRSFSSFSRLFTAQYQQSPSNYRKAFLEEKADVPCLGSH